MNALAIDLGGSHATCAVVRGRQILACAQVSNEQRAGLGALLAPVAASLHALLKQTQIRPDDCAGLAFGFCGLVDPVRNRVLSTNDKYADAPALDLRAWAGAHFGLPLRLENDARLALLGERHAGAARGFDDVVMITLGTGIGGAAMIGGRLVHGKHFQAGCLGGHLLADYRGRVCTCGNIGCVEAEASSWSLDAICREQPLFHESALADEKAIAFESVFRLAAAGDACAIAVRDRCIRVWSAAAVSLIHAYDPEVLVVGGGVMKAQTQILPAMKEYVERHAWTPWGRVRVCAAELGNTAALLGAIPLFEATTA